MSDVERRWENGIHHHPLSVELMKHMKRMDTGDQADLRTGGDGDHGETLMFLMDSHFEQLGALRLDGTVDLEDRSKLERVIGGALRSAIKDHGPLEVGQIPSATKRIIGALKTHNRTSKEAKTTLRREDAS